MAWTRSHKKSSGGGIIPVSLLDYCRIGSGSNRYQSPRDANNYIEISDKTVTLKRNGSDPMLWIFSPIMVETGKNYGFFFDSISNTNGYGYLEKTFDISVNPIVVAQRFQTVGMSGSNYVIFTAPDDCYVGIALWSGNSNDIVVVNPQFYAF